MTKLIKIAATAVFLLSASLLTAALASADPVDDVVAANAIPNRDLIYAGQILTIPGSSDYTVAAGDTLTTIMAAHSVPVVTNVAAVAPVPVPTPPMAPEASQPVSAPAPVHESVNWDAVAACESGGNWAINTGNSFHGGLQFTLGTWHSNGGQGMPENASRSEQIRVAENVLHTQGIKAWPTCGKRG